MEAVQQHGAFLRDLAESPRHALGSRLIIQRRIIEEIGQSAEQVCLHATYEVGRIRIVRAACSESGQSVPGSGERRLGFIHGRRDLGRNPRWIVFGDDLPPRLSEEKKASQLRDAFGA